jgi:hypothetical protein
MTKEADVIREQIETLHEYIHLLKKTGRIFWGFRLTSAEQTVLSAVDRRIGWPTQIWAILAGLGMALLGLGLGRLFVRNPLFLLPVIIIAGLIGVWTVIWIYHQARKQITKKEIQIAQLEIYRLEGMLNQ